jgi:hypothetical protein
VSDLTGRSAHQEPERIQRSACSQPVELFHATATCRSSWNGVRNKIAAGVANVAGFTASIWPPLRMRVKDRCGNPTIFLDAGLKRVYNRTVTVCARFATPTTKV